MLRDELLQQLKAAQPTIDTIKTYWQNAGIEARFAALEKRMHEENFWQAKDQIEISREHQRHKALVEEYSRLMADYEDSGEMLDLFDEASEDLAAMQKEIKRLCRGLTTFKILLLLSGEQDQKNCYLSINAGAGGTESQDWTGMLLRMFLRFCERQNLNATILDQQDGEEAGIKSATLFIKGTNAYGLLKSEAGIHRLVRISPYDSAKRRHTSFAAVSLTPEAIEAAIEIDKDDLRIDTYRAGGKGGQHVNKTDSAVRITHLPSGIVVQCQNERSQLQNKTTSMKMLMAKLVEKQQEEARAKKAAVKKKKIEWGSQIRSYVLHPYKMVKDHRTSHESPQPDTVLDGDLMPFIEHFLTTTQ